MSDDVIRRLPFPPAQNLLLHYLRYAQRLPNCAQDRQLALAPVAEARAKAARRVSWAVLFMKAYALVAKEEPVLRRFPMPWPWLHLREAQTSTAMVAIHRRFQDENWLFFAKFQQPENHSLGDLQYQMDLAQNGEVAAAYASQLRYGRKPRWLGHLAFRTGMELFACERLRRFGTFGLSSVAGLNSTIQQPPNILTSTITYGPVEADGRCRFTIVYDHRLMNGTQVAQVMERMQAAFDGPILEELRRMA